MFEALLPVLLGFRSVSSPPTTAMSVLQSLTIVPPSAIELQHVTASASGIVVMDAKNGQIVYEKNANQRRPMASLTKLMTAVLIAENHSALEQVLITPEAAAATGQVSGFKAGDVYTVGDLLSALLINSSNDAAIALAMHHSETEADFVLRMNERAKFLGLHNTSFGNASGLDHPLQYSTPKDIAWLTQYASRYPMITQRMGQADTFIYNIDGEPMELHHTHTLLHQVPEITHQPQWTVKGGKTGTTYGAKQCLMSMITDSKSDYIVVIMHSDQRYRDMANVLSVLPSAATPNLQAAL